MAHAPDIAYTSVFHNIVARSSLAATSRRSQRRSRNNIVKYVRTWSLMQCKHVAEPLNAEQGWKNLGFLEFFLGFKGFL